MARTAGGVKRKIEAENKGEKNKRETVNNSEQNAISTGKRKRSENDDEEIEIPGEIEIPVDNAVKRRKIRDLINCAYSYSARLNTSFALVIQVPGSSDLIVAGVGFTLGSLRKRIQVRLVKFIPPETEGVYRPSLQVCRNIKMNESLTTKGRSPQGDTQTPKSATSDAEKKPTKSGPKSGATMSDKSKKPGPSGSSEVSAKPSTSKEKQLKSKESNSPKEMSIRQTWDASSKTEGLTTEKKHKLTKKKATLDLKMPGNGTIKRTTFKTPAKKSAFSLT